MKNIYLDNAATTQIDEKVLKTMLPYFNEKYGNASSKHIFGAEAKETLAKARKTIAKSIGASPDEIVFTSGGTESNNFTLKGLFFSNIKKGKNHIITTKVEHDCVLNSCKWLETQGAKVTYLDVNSEGFIIPSQIEKTITEKTFLVSVIHGHNEIGTINDLRKIGEICKQKNVLFHSDACQSYTKVPIDVKKDNIDLLTLNAHKIHGPKGVGALYIRKGIEITPLLTGGGQEKGLRSGTENIPGIVGFASASEAISSSDIKRMNTLRDKLINNLTKIPNVKLNGATGEKRLCNNVNLTFDNIDGEILGGYLEHYGIMSSTGSACMSNTNQHSSHVLKALGLSEKDASSSIRLSLSKYTTEKEIDFVLEVLPKIVEKLTRYS
ncbi:MAG: cysteine desulfurase family protein [Nanoarchaeota archaeon]|nr:cysteine desulfurase family protein [Nanoarchaeota archaeon]